MKDTTKPGYPSNDQVSGHTPEPINEEKTVLIGADDSSTGQQKNISSSGNQERPSQPRIPWPARDNAQEPAERDSEKTELLTSSGPAAEETTPNPPDEHEQEDTSGEETQLFGAISDWNDTDADIAALAGNKWVDAVVGWLVIVKGPGIGRSVEIGAGANPIGRDESQKLRLDFGDPKIHREKHAALIYEPLSRRFYLQAGDARNLTYVDGELVLSPLELTGGETIGLGKTQLRFVPFCGANFSWDYDGAPE